MRSPTLVDQGRPSSHDRPSPEVRTMQAIGTTASVVVEDPTLADAALGLLAVDLSDLDEACSRFRPDSELRRIERLGQGRPMPASPLLFAALEAATAVAARTAGIVDPTIGSALIELGYDRDFATITSDTGDGSVDGAAPVGEPQPAPGWWQVRLYADTRTVVIPAGVHVDLGSTGKAFAADRSARRIAEALGCGVLVNLGGDVAVSGPAPVEGWGVGIAPSCATAPGDADTVVALRSGGLATSGTTARTWSRNGRHVHHIVDPWTGEVAPSTWALVSVVADSCLEANGWSTASVVWGADAPGNLEAHGVRARLVSSDGTVVTVGGWPGVTAGPAIFEEVA
jgi:thiamine biosynthesis lipoprotein